MNRCGICTRKFNNSDLLQSTQDEYFCKECFKSEFFGVTDEKKTEPEHKCKGAPPTERKKMFSMAELAAIKKEHEERREYYTSTRPLQCPHINCNRCVSVLELCAHFQHEHIEVPIIQTLLDTRNTLTFHPKEIRHGITKCLCLLTVPPPMEKPNSSTTDSPPENQQTGATLTVLASRVATAQLEEEIEGSLEDDESNATAVENDKIILWVASNVVCDTTCTVAVSTISENVRVKYRGPVLQLGSNPKKLCMKGDCLILSHFHYLGMSENGLNPLQLDVVVHSED